MKCLVKHTGGNVKVQPKYKTIENFAAWLTEGHFKPSAKFLRDMIVGIYYARSVNLTEVAAVLSEDINLHATQKRLSRNLSRKELTDTVANQILQFSAGYVKENTTLVVICHSLEKPKCRKMQYEDESRAFTHDDYSYRICEVVAHDTGTDFYTPLLSVLWSRSAPDYVSDTDMIRKLIDRVLAATNGRGVLALTPEFLPEETIHKLIQSQDYRFTANIISGHVMHRRQSRTIDDLVENCETVYGGTMFKFSGMNVGHKDLGHNNVGHNKEILLFMQYGSMPVRLPDSPRPLNMIVLKTTNQSGKSGRPLALITSELKQRSRQAHIAHIETDFLVWNLAESILEQKSDFSPGGFRVLHYERLQLLMTLLHAVIFFDAQTTEHLKNHGVSLQPIPGDHIRDFLLPGEAEGLQALPSS